MPLPAERCGPVDVGPLPGAGVRPHVAAAEAGVGDADQHLALVGRGHRHIVDQADLAGCGKFDGFHVDGLLEFW